MAQVLEFLKITRLGQHLPALRAATAAQLHQTQAGQPLLRPQPPVQQGQLLPAWPPVQLLRLLHRLPPQLPAEVHHPGSSPAPPRWSPPARACT